MGLELQSIPSRPLFPTDKIPTLVDNLSAFDSLFKPHEIVYRILHLGVSALIMNHSPMTRGKKKFNNAAKCKNDIKEHM